MAQPIEVVTYVYGKDVKQMDKVELLQALKQTVSAKAELTKGLESIESSYVNSKIVEADEAITLLTKLLDE